MTKEDYARENRELRNYIDRLENELDRQPDVFQEKTLDATLQKAGAEQKITSSESDDDMEDLLAKYRKYRKMTGEKPAGKEAKINFDSINEYLRCDKDE